MRVSLLTCFSNFVNTVMKFHFPQNRGILTNKLKVVTVHSMKAYAGVVV